MRPLTPADYNLLQTIEINTDLLVRWRFRGATPSPERWVQTLWQDVLCQHLVLGATDGRPIGLVAAYQANFQDQYAYLSVSRLTTTGRSPTLIFGLALFIDCIFTCWNFRKLYLETSEYNYTAFESGVGRYFELEGRLREHSFYDGMYWDQLTLAIYRDRWETAAQRLLKAERIEQPRYVRVRIPAELRESR